MAFFRTVLPSNLIYTHSLFKERRRPI
uniref:Uncharacterized protein n=1 Tax=Arundo donax TaxID=35708 RepID=A0A0A9FXS4_ARUDO